MTFNDHLLADEAKALVERLRGKYTVTDEFSTIRRPVNPDGHEAADLIETQAREIERLTLVGRALRMQRDASRAALGAKDD